MARKPTDAVQLKLRFSEALRRRLERVAARNNRSMNTEIIHRLERSFVFDARELERARSLRESHRRFEEQTGPSEGISTVIDKLDRIIAALELQQPEDEEAPL